MQPINLALVARDHPKARWTSFGKPVIGMAIAMYSSATPEEKAVVRRCLNWQIRNLTWTELVWGLPMGSRKMNNFRVTDSMIQRIADSIEQTIGLMKLGPNDIYTSHGSMAVGDITQGFEWCCDAAWSGIIDNIDTRLLIPLPPQDQRIEKYVALTSAYCEIMNRERDILASEIERIVAFSRRTGAWTAIVAGYAATSIARKTRPVPEATWGVFRAGAIASMVAHDLSIDVSMTRESMTEEASKHLAWIDRALTAQKSDVQIAEYIASIYSSKTQHLIKPISDAIQMQAELFSRDVMGIIALLDTDLPSRLPN